MKRVFPYSRGVIARHHLPLVVKSADSRLVGRRPFLKSAEKSTLGLGLSGM